MKRHSKKNIIVLFFILFAAIIFIVFFKNNSNKKTSNKKEATKLKEVKNEITAIKSSTIFFPYWSLTSDKSKLKEYDNLIYFGIVPSTDGINKQEAGYYGVEDFLSLIPSGKKKLLTLRMMDDDANDFILNNSEIQKKIIQETLETVEQNSFDGVVLDLEFFSLFNTDLTVQINKFVQQFYSETKKNYRQFFLTVYGDTFYRKRPFDVRVLAKNSDGIMIMAYDFHKSRGEPGPNFPLDAGLKYGYDFKTMISDFAQVVPKEKLTVVFGMFGYEWLVDEKKRPITQAKALTLNQIREKFLKKCDFKNCLIKRDKSSKETEINYIVSSPTPDEQNIYRIDYHIVWFEDEESIKAKTDYLMEKGISAISYWAYGYF